MCGIAGCWQFSGTIAESTVWRMARSLRHRGPDGEGVWIDSNGDIGLGHQRLSILDLSEAGNQPMVSACGRYVLVFNGEIYNHLDLRVELEGIGGAPDWRGHSDTETLLAALRHWGIHEALRRANGMFAFALWDRKSRKLNLARDRMGEKPLYYGWIAGAFVFASELKAIAGHPKFDPRIDSNALGHFLRHNYVPAPHCIYQGLYKLQPGCWVTVAGGGNKSSEVKPYWRLRDVARDGVSEAIAARTDHAETLRELLLDSVDKRMISDVPLGALLSGGIDSSMIVALMQEVSSKPVRTFSIGFSERSHDEAHFARGVAHHLGTEHTELYVNSRDALSVIPEIPDTWDEPFSDSSQIPTARVSGLARDHVKVALSGDGGDELFFGYDRYRRACILRRLQRFTPGPLGNAIASFLSRAPSRAFDRLGAVLPGPLSVHSLGDRMRKAASLVGQPDPGALYLQLLSHWKQPEALIRASGVAGQPTVADLWPNELADFRDQMMLCDQENYLPDDILAKVDRASMAVGLELRVPLLDHRVVELAWAIPHAQKVRRKQPKWLLREILRNYLPPDLIDRPKMGFGVPIEAWLRGPLREWAEEMLSERRIREAGILEPQPIRQMWREHVSGVRRWHYYLWDILMFQAWHDRWIKRASQIKPRRDSVSGGIS